MSPGGQNYLWFGTMVTSRLEVSAAKAVSGHAPPAFRLPLLCLLQMSVYSVPVWPCLLLHGLEQDSGGLPALPMFLAPDTLMKRSLGHSIHLETSVSRQGSVEALRLSAGPNFTLMASIPQSLSSGVVAVFCLLVSLKMAEFMFLCSVLLNFDLCKEGI